MKAVIDIGGTNTRIGLSANNKDFVSIEKFPTMGNFFEQIEKISNYLKDKKISQLIIGAAGIINKKGGRLIKSPHLPDWNDKNIKEILADRLGVPVFLENDAALAGLAEANQDSVKNFSIIAYLTISTGVGGARIVNQKIDQASHGFEPGHQIIVSEGKEWPYCGQRGCLEAYISGTAHPTNDFSEQYYQYFAQGLVNIMVLWSPDAIILGGSVSDHLSLDLLKSAVKKNLSIVEAPPIFKRQLGDEAGLCGGLLL